MAAPNFTNLKDMKALAIRLARADEDEDEDGMADFLYSTSHVAGDVTTYRPFEAAASWLGTNANRFAKGEDGVAFTDLEAVKAELRERQRSEDVRLGLVAQPSTFGLFPGVAR